jgi:hypothetical protein
MMLTLNAGIVLPLLIGFTDIVLRAAVKEHMTPSALLILSFSVQFLGYLIGFFFLWRWLFASYRFEVPKALIARATAAFLLITLLFYAFLFRVDNLLSNLVWLLFDAAVILSFYLIGRHALCRAEAS